jgi:hypothetical protein
MKTFYSYDPATGALVGQGLADPNPMYEAAHLEALAIRADLAQGKEGDAARAEALEQEQEFLLPAHATWSVPPVDVEGHYAAWSGASWDLVAIPQPAPAEEPAAAAEPAAVGAEHVPAPELSDEEKALQAATARVEEHMQGMARGAGYKSLESAISYAEEAAVERFQEEGRKFRRWRSLMWDWFHKEEVQAEVLAGKFHLRDLNTEAPRLNPDQPA